jgi:hypothetical protein
MLDPASLIRQYLLFFILPLWMAGGLADYVLHRRTHIEDTSGTKESLLHALQLGEAGLPFLLGLLLDINALVLLVMLVALLAHEATALWDLHVAIHRRYVGVLEQHIHSFLELLPLMGVPFVTILYWDQFLALFGMGSESARFEVHLKSNPLSFTYLICSLSAVVLLIVLPYGEELGRCIAAARRRRQQEYVAARIKQAA